MSRTRSCFRGKPGSTRPSLAGPPGAPPGVHVRGPLPDRALANVLRLRVAVIYIRSVYINLSAAALAALLQSACLRRGLGDAPLRRPAGGCPGAARGAGPPRLCAPRPAASARGSPAARPTRAAQRRAGRRGRPGGRPGSAEAGGPAARETLSGQFRTHDSCAGSSSVTAGTVPGYL